MLTYDFQFLIIFHQPALPLKEFIKLNKFGIVGKWLPNGSWLYTCSLKRKKWSWKPGQRVFSIFYLKRRQSGFWETKSFNSFWLGMYNFCFEEETISRAFSAGLVGLELCSCLYKNKTVLTKSQWVLICYLCFWLHKKSFITKDHSISLWIYLTIMSRSNHYKIFWKNVFRLMPSMKNSKELFFVCRPAKCNLVRKELLHRLWWDFDEIFSNIFYTLC